MTREARRAAGWRDENLGIYKNVPGRKASMNDFGCRVAEA